MIIRTNPTKSKSKSKSKSKKGSRRSVRKGAGHGGLTAAQMRLFAKSGRATRGGRRPARRKGAARGTRRNPPAMVPFLNPSAGGFPLPGEVYGATSRRLRGAGKRGRLRAQAVATRTALARKRVQRKAAKAKSTTALRKRLGQLDARLRKVEKKVTTVTKKLAAKPRAKQLGSGR